MSGWRIIWTALFLLLSICPVTAIQITGYTSTANNRFSSGYPSGPVNNTSLSFVGSGYDWSGVGWAASDSTKSFGFLSPQHYLVARHYGGATTINLFGGDGTVHAATQTSVTDTGYGIVFSGQTVGDMSLGKLTSPANASWDIARYAVLDLNATSSINSVYDGEPLLVYGRGPNGSQSTRVGNASVSSTALSGANSFITTSRLDVQLEIGDSGSPAFIGWTNPNGGKELTILGTNAAVDASSNYLNYIANSFVINQLNAMMTPDGFVLRVVGDPSATWVGASGANGSKLNRPANWSGSAVPTDLFSLFDANSTSFKSLDVNAATNLRGAYFKATGASGNGFSFSGNSSLTIGRGGLTNYDISRQVFSASLTLGDNQYWDAGPGGITAANINTNSKLLEISGNSTITGQISGNGSIALSGGRLDLSGTSTYTGKTWVHVGTLSVSGNISSSSVVNIDTGARLQGTGKVSSISGSGSVDPGGSTGILTATSIAPQGGLGFNFEFTQTGSPNYGNATSSGNDLLQLTAATPFSQSLSASNNVNIFLQIPSIQVGDTFRGGFFTNRDVSFLSSIQSAAFLYYLANAGGPVVYNGVHYALYSGPLTFQLDTVAETAGFSSDTEAGYVLKVSTIPEPASLFLILAGLSLILLLRAPAARSLKD